MTMTSGRSRALTLTPMFSPSAVNKPMMSTVADIVDEGLGEEFEDTPWVPPTVKRVRLKKPFSKVKTIMRLELVYTHRRLALFL